MKLVLLEDDTALRNNIREFLQLHRYEIEAYANGEELLDNCAFDADGYLLDINVPGADGFEVIDWVLRNAPGAPVIFMTAFTDIESISRAYRLGCGDYLKKPFDLTELLLRLQKLLGADRERGMALCETCSYDPHTQQIRRNGALVKLSKTQRQIVSLMILHKNNLVTYGQLVDEVWEGADIMHNTIASHMREIRRLVPELQIESIRSEGYILTLR